MNSIVILYCAFIPFVLQAQRTITGIVKTEKGVLLQGANVYEKGTYNGTTTKADGSFVIEVSANEALLVVGFLGYQRQEIALSKKTDFTVILKQEQNVVDEVVVTAGTFEAGEKNRAVMLDPVEMATTASSDGDIYGALSTFPGAQKNGKTGELVVRGGEAYETKTYMDGMLVSSPYSSSMPDLPTRGRFTPFMFNGVMFSTGGYSAEYGQALSSVLELQTPGLFDEDVTSISLMNVGMGASLTRKYVRNAFSGELAYNNTWPYFAMAKHDLDWIQAPENGSAKLYYRQKLGKTGMLKADIIANESYSELDYSNVDNVYSRVGLRNSNQFAKTTYNTKIGEKWMLKSGVAINTNADHTSLDSMDVEEILQSAHIKLAAIHYLNEDFTLKFGSDVIYTGYEFGFRQDSIHEKIQLDSKDWLSGIYAESDVKLNSKIAFRLGMRGEYSTLTGKTNMAPRASLAGKLTKHSQLSLAAGYFYQQAQSDYTIYSSALNYEKAQHLLINYQYKKEERILRVELFHKQYSDLVTYTVGDKRPIENIRNDGEGYAYGFDFFWKDAITITNTSYWVSYSYTKSKRKYKDFTEAATPEFVAPHALSLVAKHWLQRINTQVSGTYSFKNGYFYNDLNKHEFMTGKTPAIHDLSLSISYLTNILRQFTIVHFSVSNLLGQQHIYSYRYSDLPNKKGMYEATPVASFMQRNFIIGLFISIK